MTDGSNVCRQIASRRRTCGSETCRARVSCISTAAASVLTPSQPDAGRTAARPSERTTAGRPNLTPAARLSTLTTSRPQQCGRASEFVPRIECAIGNSSAASSRCTGTIAHGCGRRTSALLLRPSAALRSVARRRRAHQQSGRCTCIRSSPHLSRCSSCRRWSARGVTADDKKPKKKAEPKAEPNDQPDTRSR